MMTVTKHHYLTETQLSQNIDLSSNDKNSSLIEIFTSPSCHNMAVGSCDNIEFLKSFHDNQVNKVSLFETFNRNIVELQWQNNFYAIFILLWVTRGTPLINLVLFLVTNEEIYLKASLVTSFCMILYQLFHLVLDPVYYFRGKQYQWIDLIGHICAVIWIFTTLDLL